MALYGAYQRITTGNVQTTVDSSTLPLNGPPRQPLGTIYSPPISVALATPHGAGAPPVYKYVQYQSTANPAVVAAPAPVYYTDETFTIVSGVFSESLTASAASVAGYLMPNSTALSTLTAATLNGNWVWIQIAGFLAGAYAPTSGGAVGSTIQGLTGNWTSIAVGAGTAPVNRVLGIQLTAIASSACDVLVSGYQTFWGS
jgi:hypothetical protein